MESQKELVQPVLFYLSIAALIIGYYEALYKQLTKRHLQFRFLVGNLLVNQHAIDELIDYLLSVDEFSEHVIVVCYVRVLILLEGLYNSKPLE